MTEGRLDAHELDEALAATATDVTDLDPGGPGAGSRSGPPGRRRTRTLRHPLVVAALAVGAVGTVLGVRAYVVSRPPDLATSVDAVVGATIGDTGFITVDPAALDMQLMLVVRGRTDRPPVEARGLVAPGLADVVLHQDGERLSVSARPDCATSSLDPTAPDTPDYLVRVEQQDAWGRTVSDDVPLPALLAQQVTRTARMLCLVAATRDVMVVGLATGSSPGTVVVTVVNRGTAPVYLQDVSVGPELDRVGWFPASPTRLPGDSSRVAVAVQARSERCIVNAPELPDPVPMTVALSAGPDTSPVLETDVTVPAESEQLARQMARRPC